MVCGRGQTCLVLQTLEVPMNHFGSFGLAVSRNVYNQCAINGCHFCLVISRKEESSRRDTPQKESTEATDDMLGITFFADESDLTKLYLSLSEEDTLVSSVTLTRTKPEIDSLVNNGQVASSTGSPESIGLARKWLTDCLTLHSCANSNLDSYWNPTRLLDIGLGPVPEPRVFLTAKVKKDDEANMTRFIPFSKLTKSVQDAIHTMQHLGYRYLLVDYLCILQDCPLDWKQESTVMDKVYSHSTCTIAATAATDGNEGLFFKRNPRLVKPKEIRVPIRQEEYDHFVIDSTLLEDEIYSAPLSKRAWVMQETILSPRIIHFAKDQLFWTCNENESCESFPTRLPKDLATGFPGFPSNTPGKYASLASRVWHMGASQLAFAMSKNDLIESMMYRGQPYILDLPKDIILDESYQGMESGSSASLNAKCIAQRRYHNNIYQEIWARIVEEYSSRCLTQADDRVLAIQGIANEMKLHIDSPYIAGLWYMNLPLDLLWECLAGERCVRAASYRAPSWSWLSIDGPVALPNFYFGTPQPKVEIIESSTSLQGTDWGVDPHDNFLHIRGHLARGLIDRSDNTGSSLCYNVLGYKPIETYGPYEYLGFEIICDFPQVGIEGLMEIYIVELVGYGRYYDTNTSCARGLVLEKVEGKSEFTRYGYFNFGGDLGRLAGLVEAFDKFDRSETSKALSYEKRGNARMYDIYLI